MRRKQFGPNLLPVPARPSFWWRLLSQLAHFFALMLWVAGGLAILAGMPELGLAIFAVIILNGLFAFLQEYRAEKAGDRLRDLLPRRVTVIRDTKRLTIDASELVPGDLVVVHAGDRISADISLSEAHGLCIDNSALTGESIPATAQPGQLILAGTFAVEGEGIGFVTATGSSTRLARIAQMAVGRRPRTPLAAELHRVVRVITFVCLAVGSVFMLIAMLVGIRLSDAFLFALGVTVALVPEALLPTVTLSLAIGAERMAARGALVRRLESVETLGSTTFICTDKTGTLTRNEMAVVEAWTPAGRAAIEGAGYEPVGTIRADTASVSRLRELALTGALHLTGKAALCGGRWIAQGHPLEAALDVFARRLGVDVESEERASPATLRFPFDPRRRRMSVVSGKRVIVRGAPEAVFACCQEIGEAENVVSSMTERGFRVLAVAVKDLSDADSSGSAESIETGLTLLGVVGIEDPPRPEAARAIAACRAAGIRVAMVTGDHPGTARAIAREVGLLNAAGVVLEGKDLPVDEEILGVMVDCDGAVVSRVSPEEKLRIARALRRRGHVVAMTGDGINDAPALRECDIGVAMGLSGTDVAREAADLVLLDDNFSTIVAAIEQGRTTFANARRFLTYHLTDNIAELTPFVVWALSGARFPLALGVLQVLCLDIGTDILPAVALGAERTSPRALRRPPQGRHLIDAPLLMRAFCVLGPVESLVEMLAFLAVLLSAGWRPGTPFPTGPALLAASGSAFTAVVMGQMANAFACRSASERPGRLGWLSNRYLVLAIVLELAMLAGFLYITPLARLLGQAPPSSVGYLTAVLAIPAVFLADALHKKWKHRGATGQTWTAGIVR